MDKDNPPTRIVKLQYRNYEPGEFTDRQPRTFEETIRLIGSFPWEDQRDNLKAGLTGPSVTIEGEYHRYLKLALYYHGSFILYYLDDSNRLYSKSFPQLQDAFPWLQSFFDDNLLDTSLLEPQPSWMQGKLKHFADATFHYSVNRPRILLLNAFLGFCVALLIAVEIILVKKTIENSLLFLIPTGLFLLIALLMATTLAMSINHYRYASGKELILSSGNPVFYYGTIGSPEQWNKKDILSITYFGATDARSGKYGTFYRILIRTAGSPQPRTLFLPSILIPDNVLPAKFPAVKIDYKQKTFPFIPPSASTPS